MAQLMKISVVVTENDNTTLETRWIAARDIHECYATTYTLNDEEHDGTMVERQPGTNPQDLIIAEELSSFASRVTALADKVELVE